MSYRFLSAKINCFIIDISLARAWWCMNDGVGLTRRFRDQKLVVVGKEWRAVNPNGLTHSGTHAGNERRRVEAVPPRNTEFSAGSV